MAEPPKIPLFKPNKEEAKIIIHANKEFMKRYVSGILIGLGSAYFLLRSTRTQTRTARGFGAYFVLGLTGEYIGRVIGVARAMEELKRLPPDSPLKEFVDKMFVFQSYFLMILSLVQIENQLERIIFLVLLLP